MEEIFESIFNEIIGTARYYLSKLNRENELHRIRRFAKRNYACKEQYNNLVQLMKYHSELDCWQFILGNYEWLYSKGFNLIPFNIVRFKAGYTGKRYYDNLILRHNIDIPMGYPTDSYKSISAYRRDGLLEFIDFYNKSGNLTERYDYHIKYIGQNRTSSLIYTKVIDDLYHVYVYSVNGFRQAYYTRKPSYAKHGGCIIYHDDSECANIEEQYDDGVLKSRNEYDKNGTLITSKEF